MNKALDEVRAAESRQMAQDGHQPLLKKSRWCVLKRKENLTSQQKFRLRELLRYNLQTVRAYLLKEDFQQLWEYNSPTWAALFLDFWCYQTMRSRIEPMKKNRPDVARSPRAAAQLFQGQKTVFQRCGRGPEQQSQSHHEKILWLSHLPYPGTRALSLTWQTA
jgi:transposase